MTKRPRWKTIILAIVSLFGIAAVISGSFAAYTNQAYKRGIVRNNGSERVRFSSNYLQLCNKSVANDSTQYPEKWISYSEGTTGTLEISLEIYNYIFGNTDLKNERDIEYNLTIQFQGAMTDGYKVNGNSVTNYSYTKQDILIGRRASKNTYTLTIPAKDLNRVKIIASAVPTNPLVTSNQILAAVIAPGTAATAEAFQCRGSFIDSSSSAQPAQFDAFNYEVSVSGGIGEVTLTWDSTQVEIDKYFLDKMKQTPKNAENGKKTLTFEMNPMDETGDYLIPFYLVKGKINKSWEEMKTIISVSGIEKTNS